MSRKSYLASLVPVIVNAILNEHQIVVDIVAFVSKGDFPRSRLGEKQRGRVLAGWVSRKMRTLAQFAIRDMDQDGRYAALEAHRASVGSIRSSIPGASSLRNMEHAPQILEHEEMTHRMDRLSMLPPQGEAFEMPVDSSHRSSPSGGGGMQLPALGIDTSVGGGSMSYNNNHGRGNQSATSGQGHEYELPNFSEFGDTPMTASQLTPHARLPAVDGRESFDEGMMWNGDNQQQHQYGAGGGGGMLGNHGANEEEEDWTRDAIMHMNLAASGNAGGGGAGSGVAR